MENVIQPSYLPNKPNKPHFLYNEENEPSESVFQEHRYKMRILTLPNNNLYFLDIVNVKRKRSSKDLIRY